MQMTALLGYCVHLTVSLILSVSGQSSPFVTGCKNNLYVLSGVLSGFCSTLFFPVLFYKTLNRQENRYMLSFRPFISIVLYLRHCNLIGFSERTTFCEHTFAVSGFIVHVAIMTL